MQKCSVNFDFVHKLADAADVETLKHFRSGFAVENKLSAGFDPVTVADKSAEKAIRAVIEKHYPEHGIIGEEYGRQNERADHQWVLDPIDGTRSYISGTPLWGTLIGLSVDGAASLGMLSQPYIRERYWGDRTSAYYRGPIGDRQLKTRNCTGLEEAIIMTTDPSLFEEQERPLYDTIENRARLARYSADCYGYAMVAAGCCDCVIESGLNTYDILPLIPIVEGAGGAITDWAGAPAENGGQILACGDKRLHEQLLRILAG
ncbi:histidinol-phosphatase [Flexibacterium corallicola]|uniref:histidinol-phosphatase n=1 Tax=Flexibacterium corallicola TaxID=3037259 RepID=UPI00286EDD7C|nr:histidinol-phosphatase [Pseudovibrio sp. M1P-2-3]